MNKNIRLLLRLVFGNYQKYDLIVYNEGKEYSVVFKDLIKNDYDKNFLYLYSDIDDELKDNISHDKLYIGTDFLRTLILNNIKAHKFLSTTPDLNKYHIKKSKNVDEYCYIFHSLVSIYKRYQDKAFHHYETIFVPSELHFKEFQKYQDIYNNKFNLIKSGYTVLDHNENAKKDNYVLIAPSWAEKNFFDEDLVDKLINLSEIEDYNFILRPHPYYYKKNKNYLDKIFNQFKKYSNLKFSIDFNRNDFFDCDILFSDMSGVVLEYFLINKKKFFCLENSTKILNENWTLFSPITIEEGLINKFAYKIKDNQISNTIRNLKNIDLNVDPRSFESYLKLINIYNYRNQSFKKVLEYLNK